MADLNTCVFLTAPPSPEKRRETNRSVTYEGKNEVQSFLKYMENGAVREEGIWEFVIQLKCATGYKAMNFIQFLG